MPVTASQLRANVYRLLDEVLESGVPLVVERNGKRLCIVPEAASPKLSRLTPHPDCIVGDPEDLVHIDWSEHWDPTL